MPSEYEDIKRSALKGIAEFMCLSARTAPKAKGQDNLVIVMLTAAEKKKLISEMQRIGKQRSRPGLIAPPVEARPFQSTHFSSPRR